MIKLKIDTPREHIILANDKEVVAEPGQFFTVSESGRRFELWQKEPLSLVKWWRTKSVQVWCGNWPD